MSQTLVAANSDVRFGPTSFGQMYNERASSGFCNVMHFNTGADASTHSCWETLVSLSYTFENDLGMNCIAQRIPHGKHFTYFDKSNMPLEIAVLAAKRRIERAAAFRWLQSLSHQIHILTRGRLTLDSFKLDSTGHVQPVAVQAGQFVLRCPAEKACSTSLLW